MNLINQIKIKNNFLWHIVKIYNLFDVVTVLVDINGVPIPSQKNVDNSHYVDWWL